MMLSRGGDKKAIGSLSLSMILIFFQDECGDED